MRLWSKENVQWLNRTRNKAACSKVVIKVSKPIGTEIRRRQAEEAAERDKPKGDADSVGTVGT